MCLDGTYLDDDCATVNTGWLNHLTNNCIVIYIVDVEGSFILDENYTPEYRSELFITSLSSLVTHFLQTAG